MRVDREAATRDRERTRRRYSRDIHVRYMSSWRNLKEKLLSAYSCNEQQCPMIRERLLRHHQSVHGRGRYKTKCSLATSKSKNCVSIKAGPDFDHYSDQQCTECPMSHTSSDYSKRSSNRTGCVKPIIRGTLKTEKKFAQCCTSPTNTGEKNEQIICEPRAAKSRFDQYVDTSCIKGMMTKNNDAYDKEMNKRSSNINNTSDTTSNAERRTYTTICPDSTTCKNRQNNSNHDLEMLDVCGNTNDTTSRRYVDSCTTPSAPTLTHGSNNFCESEIPSYTDGRTEYAANYRNACTDYTYDDNFACATRYGGGCSTLPNIKFMTNRNYANGCCDNIKMLDCTDNFTRCSNSYIGNIEAPKFPIQQSRNFNEDSQPSTSKTFTSKTDKPTNTPIMVDGETSSENHNSNLTPYKDLNTIDESTGGDSIMSSLMTIVKNRKNGKNKKHKISKTSLTRRSNNSDTSQYAYKPMPPYAVENNNKTDSKLSVRNNGTRHRRNNNINSIYREVKEWIREVPMYPGSEKEAEEKSTSAINSLVKTLHEIFREAGSPSYNEKVRNAIEICLNKIPVWYPGPKREQSGFKHSLANRLTHRITKLNKKNVGINSKRKGSRLAVTEVHTSLTACNQSFSSQLTVDPKDVEVKICIIDWLRFIYSKNSTNYVMKNQIFFIADIVILHIKPLLNKPMSTKSLKINLKTTIQKIMHDLPIVIDCPFNRDMHVQDLADDLTTSLLCIQAKYGSKYSNFSAAPKFSSIHSFPSQRVISSEIEKCFENAKIDFNDMVIDEARKIIENCYEVTNTKGNRHARNEIINLLVTCTNLSEVEAWNLAKMITRKLKKVFNGSEECSSSQTCSQLQKQFITSVYTSIEGASLTYPITSTPKKKRVKKEVYKLSPQEKQYMESVKSLVRGWMDILPDNLSTPNEKEFKENMISDLAGDITDNAKLRQLAPDPTMNNREVLKYILSRWIFRLGVFEFQDVDDEMEVFLDKLQELPVPSLTQPYYGNRQTMENLKFNEGKRKDGNWLDNFVPKGIDVLQDEISIWIREQPSEIFRNNDQEFRQKKIKALAKALGNKEGKNWSSDKISKNISKWLNQVLKPEKRRDISELTDNLKDRIINLPQDATLAEIVENREMAREAYKKSKSEIANSRKTYSNNCKDNEPADLENTMAIFISKFIEHHYDTDDPLAWHAFNRLLNSHLLSLNPSTRKEIYDNFEKNEYDSRFPPEKVLKELEYIKDISDWLKNIPVDAAYNTLGNRERIDFVNSLALSIREIEEDRKNDPGAMDYDLYLFNEIGEYLTLLPIPKEHHCHFNFIVGQLFKKIIVHRGSSYFEGNQSINTTGINSDNIGDFIEEFIRINSDGIAYDELKMEAWAIRLIREIKKLIQTSPGLSKAHIYGKLAIVRIPSNETAKLFVLELDYVKEITNWIKNLPLLPMNDSEKDNVTKHICELAEKIVETDRKKNDNPNDKGSDTDFTDYVAKWISELPLDKRQKINLPIVTRQLTKRIEKLKQKDNSPPSNIFESPSNNSIKSKKSKSLIYKGSKKNQSSNLPSPNIFEYPSKKSIKSKKSKSSIYKGLNKNQSLNLPSPSIFESPSNKSIKSKKSKSSIDKGINKNKSLNTNNIIDAIVKWSKALPVKAENDDAKTNIKKDICRRLFQDMGQFNMNPVLNNDDMLYRSKLDDVIDTILENIPQNEELKSQKEKLKGDIISTLADIRKEIKDKTAGSTYERNLEKTIDSSIPNPVPCNQLYDPGFEIYKHRLATAFILENFDHGMDAVKIKYETLLKKEIEKYFNHARYRNSIPLSQDQLNNELYNALFNVPIPNEASVIDEVEKVKTRCEIDAWFEELPIKETNGIIELLDYDKILSMLAQRIHEIEKSEPKSDSNNVFKEIMKWLAMMPLKPGNESRHEEFATILQKRLKSTRDQRRCILGNSKKKNKKDKAKTKAKVTTKMSKENSQIAGPSSDSKIWASTHDITNSRNPKISPADEINEIVHNWCDQLPINVNNRGNAQILRDDLAVKIIIKISDINANNEIFKDDDLYDKLLSEEIERILSTIPTNCYFDENIGRKIFELKESIKSVKPRIEEERARYNYVQELLKIIDRNVEKPQAKCPEKEAYFNELRNNIIDDFILYKYSNDDDADKQIHKINLLDNMSKLALANTKSNISIDKNGKNNNLLLKSNHLISEMAKILPKSNNIVRDKVEEIRIKKQIANFFDEIGVSNKNIAKVTYLKPGLAQKLKNLETTGYSAENENKMKQDVMKCLKKLGKEKKSAAIDAFISKLKNSEKHRRMPQGNKENPELTKPDCSQAYPSKSQDVRNENFYMPRQTVDSNIPANFARKIACPPLIPPSRALGTKTVETVEEVRQSYQPNCDRDNNNIMDNVVNEGEEIALRESENEDSSSDNEDERTCLCKKTYGGRHRRSPYCMMPIPMPMPYVCQRRDLLRSLWCGMPLPLF